MSCIVLSYFHAFSNFIISIADFTFFVPLYYFSPSAVVLVLTESFLLSEQHSYLYLLSEVCTTYSLWFGISQFCTPRCWRPAFGVAHIYLHCSGLTVRVMMYQGRFNTMTAELRQGPKARAWPWSQLPHSHTHKGHTDNASGYQLFSQHLYPRLPSCTISKLPSAHLPRTGDSLQGLLVHSVPYCITEGLLFFTVYFHTL